MSLPLPLSLGDRLMLRKPHPCGSVFWQITRLGADIRIRCEGCGHSVLLPRARLEKMIRKNLGGVNEGRNHRTD